MEDGSGEGESGRLSRVYLRQLDVDVEYSTAVWCVRRPRDCAGPVKHVLVTDGCGGACRERIVLEFQPFLSESSESHFGCRDRQVKMIAILTKAKISQWLTGVSFWTP